MNINRIFLAFTLGTFTLCAENVLAQDQPEMTRVEFERLDSVQAVEEKEQIVQAQAEEDATRISDAKDARNETKALAKETRRIDREANSAAREARLFLRAEQKAQKARKDAEKQSRKADKAKNKSDKN